MIDGSSIAKGRKSEPKKLTLISLYVPGFSVHQSKLFGFSEIIFPKATPALEKLYIIGLIAYLLLIPVIEINTLGLGLIWGLIVERYAKVVPRPELADVEKFSAKPK